ncbi:YidC/Oxa1 family membrane protein insertase [Eggerthella sp. YY7918]|uniref:YidC/Oxa1 family membrane protein insertase n=1 Tax=Eggerthella sp. (strain YY7918) TaxID=502558 RepID=UPI00021715D9|nr:YidC/Oxa1 family membrane protein insertase [Eggerthella sp. YY7918]BAK45963.1 preprotein translocase subunit YidC [Eggerthella sp. YY7918]
MWDVFKDWIFDVIQFFYGFCGDWGLAIIIVTVIFRILISPLMHKQTKSTYGMQKVQPLIQEIQRKYADDPPRLQEEMQKLYAEVKFNPLAGCLPMLLQMPIFIALFQVLSEMGSRTQGTTYEFYNLVPSLVMRPSEAFAQGFGTFVPYLILMIIFAGATFLPMVLQQMGNKDNPQRNQTLIMSAVMSLFMLWISWGSPAGVLLFWGASSLIGIAQQQISMRIMKRRDAEQAETIEVKPIEVDVTRKVKKPRPTKKGDQKKH